METTRRSEFWQTGENGFVLLKETSACLGFYNPNPSAREEQLLVSSTGQLNFPQPSLSSSRAVKFPRDRRMGGGFPLQVSAALLITDTERKEARERKRPPGVFKHLSTQIRHLHLFLCGTRQSNAPAAQ